MRVDFESRFMAILLTAIAAEVVALTLYFLLSGLRAADPLGLAVFLGTVVTCPSVVLAAAVRTRAGTAAAAVGLAALVLAAPFAVVASRESSTAALGFLAPMYAVPIGVAALMARAVASLLRRRGTSSHFCPPQGYK